jgi:hypothetical protein
MHSLLLISPVDMTRHTQVQVHHESTSPIDTLKDQIPLKSITWNPNTVHCAVHSLLSLSLSFRCTARPAICACLLPPRLLKEARLLLALSHGLSLLHLRVPHQRPNSAYRARSRPSRGAVPPSPAVVTAATPLPTGAPQLLCSERSVPRKERARWGGYIYPSKRIIRVLFAKYLTQVNSVIVMWVVFLFGWACYFISYMAKVCKSIINQIKIIKMPNQFC